jgi:hypothetical protein
VTLVLDSGALVALERNDRVMWRRYKMSLLAGVVPVSHGGVLGQVWRARGPRQALLAKALEGVHFRGLDEDLGRAAGALLGRARTNDVIDAAVVLLAQDGDQVVTSDPDDLKALAVASGCHLELIRA